MQKIAQGAEAIVYRTQIFNKNIIIKERTSKDYRNAILDHKIRKIRNKQEATLLKRCRKNNINTPYIYYINKNKIYEEEITNSKEHKIYLKEIGKEIAKLHNSNIIHGDLNIINIITNNNKIYFIDFGLGYISHKEEDKATDLLCFKKTLKSNKDTKDYWESILDSYKKKTNNNKIIEKINDVEKRGRYL